MEVKKIYTVQTAYIDEKGAVIRHRNWGFYLDFDKAEDVIVNNRTDIYEHGYYNYGIINEAPPGILMNSRYKTHWYYVDYEGVEDNSHPKVIKAVKPIDPSFCMGLDW